jgi:hypothetical protein
VENFSSDINLLGRLFETNSFPLDNRRQPVSQDPQSRERLLYEGGLFALTCAYADSYLVVLDRE